MEEVSNVRRLRASQRFKLFLPTRVRMGHNDYPGHLIDVSTSGALICSIQPCAVGSRIYIRLLGGAREARVVRRDGREYGVEFTTPLGQAEVTALLESQRDVAAA